MRRNLFSRPSSKQARSPSLPEHVSSSPSQEMPLSPPSDKVSLSGAHDTFLESPLLGGSSPSIKSKSDMSLPSKKSAQNLFSRMISGNHPSTRESTGSGNGSLWSLSTRGTTTGHETELHTSPPSSPKADASTSPLYESESKTEFMLLSHHRKGKPSIPTDKIEALEGEMIASRHNIGTASIDCDFHKIEYGQFKERPACLIIVDVRLVYPPDNTIKTVNLELQFATEIAQNLSPENPKSLQNTKTPISKVFAPEYIEGIPTYSQNTAHHNIRPKVEGLSFKIDTGGGGSQTTSTKEHRWRVQGRREENNGVYDTFGWNIFENKFSEDSVPRQLRLGMIAFHEHQPFPVDVKIGGSTRQKHRRPQATHGKRWFNPPGSEDVGRHILREAMVQNLVSKQNFLIRDLAPSRVLEGKTLNQINFSSGAGSGTDGVGVVSDLLSIGNDALTVDSPTTMMDTSFYN